MAYDRERFEAAYGEVQFWANDIWAPKKRDLYVTANQKLWRQELDRIEQAKNWETNSNAQENCQHNQLPKFKLRDTTYQSNKYAEKLNLFECWMSPAIETTFNILTNITLTTSQIRANLEIFLSSLQQKDGVSNEFKFMHHLNSNEIRKLSPISTSPSSRFQPTQFYPVYYRNTSHAYPNPHSEPIPYFRVRYTGRKHHKNSFFPIRAQLSNSVFTLKNSPVSTIDHRNDICTYFDIDYLLALNRNYIKRNRKSSFSTYGNRTIQHTTYATRTRVRSNVRHCGYSSKISTASIESIPVISNSFHDNTSLKFRTEMPKSPFMGPNDYIYIAPRIWFKPNVFTGFSEHAQVNSTNDGNETFNATQDESLGFTPMANRYNKNSATTLLMKSYPQRAADFEQLSALVSDLVHMMMDPETLDFSPRSTANMITSTPSNSPENSTIISLSSVEYEPPANTRRLYSDVLQSMPAPRPPTQRSSTDLEREALEQYHKTPTFILSKSSTSIRIMNGVPSNHSSASAQYKELERLAVEQYSGNSSETNIRSVYNTNLPQADAMQADGRKNNRVLVPPPLLKGYAKAAQQGLRKFR